VHYLLLSLPVLPKISVHLLSFVGIYLFADAHSCVELKHSAEAYIVTNFHSVTNCDEFLQMPQEVLLHLLRSDDLHVESELVVLESTLKWMSADLSARRCSIYDILDVVRLQHIPSSLLQRVIATCSDLAIKIVLQKVMQDYRTSSRFHSALQMPRRHAHRTLYVIGGYCRSPGSRWSDSYTLSQVDCYETFTKAWRTAPSLLSARSDACVVSLDGAIYAIGGESESLIFDSVERLEPSISNRWKTVEPMAVPRCSAGVCVFGQSVYVFGGWVGYESSSSIEIYDYQHRIWTNGGTMHGERRWGMGVVEYQGIGFDV
jgi:BTB And C-terminal Kelch/Kelch motif